ncbi:MAG TPA: aspartate/glutamate racemase family protein [Bacillota bacterium]|jgi:allantoin racemase
MARILYLMPGTGAPAAEKARREGLANSFLTNPQNKVIVDDVDEGPASIESSIEGDLSVRGMLNRVVRDRGRYDAVIIGCADDPGLFSLRELLEVPVVGPLETSLAVASTLGDRFGLITIGESAFPETRMILRRNGAEGRLASLRSVEVSVEEMIDERVGRDRLAESFIREGREAIREGASVILMGCMSMAFQLLDEAARGQLAAPVINPAKVAVKHAEMLLSLGLKHSVLAYPRPDLAKLKRTVLPGL